MINSQKRIITALCSLVIVFIMIVGVSYAYYATVVKGNPNETPSLKLTSGYLSIVYEGGSSEISGGSTSGTTNDLTYTKNFSVTNNGVADSYFGIWIKDYQVLDAEGNSATLSRPEDWTYELKNGDTIIKSGIFPTESESLITVYPLNVGETKNLTLTVIYNYITEEEGGTNQSADISKVLSFSVAVTQSIDTLNDANENTLLYAINTAYQANIIRNESDLITIPGKEIPNTDEASILTTEGDYGTSYVYRGNVQNNFVNYANMCWRIVRVQGNGTVKLVLADEDNECNAEAYSLNNEKSGIIKFDVGTDLIDYSYFNYGFDSSTFRLFSETGVPEVLNSWLNGGTVGGADEGITSELIQHISASDQQKLAETAWCNDTSASHYFNADLEGETPTLITKEKDKTGKYTQIGYMYGGYGRLESGSPTLKCNMEGLDNTKSTEYTSKIGLLTVDEVMFAGGASEANSNYYLYHNANNQNWLTMPPFGVGQDTWGLGYYFSINNGKLPVEADDNMEGGVAIRPSVVLKSDISIDESIEGQNGTYQNPYVIS